MKVAGGRLRIEEDGLKVEGLSSDAEPSTFNLGPAKLARQPKLAQPSTWKGGEVDKDKLSRLISIVLSAVLAVLATFGYHIVVVQPQLQAAAAMANQLCK